MGRGRLRRFQLETAEIVRAQRLVRDHFVAEGRLQGIWRGFNGIRNARRLLRLWVLRPQQFDRCCGAVEKDDQGLESGLRHGPFELRRDTFGEDLARPREVCRVRRLRRSLSARRDGRHKRWQSCKARAFVRGMETPAHASNRDQADVRDATCIKFVQDVSGSQRLVLVDGTPVLPLDTEDRLPARRRTAGGHGGIGSHDDGGSARGPALP